MLFATAALLLTMHSQQGLNACFQRAGLKYGVPPTVLKSIAYKESTMNPRAIRTNKDGTTDFGLMQVNSIHLAELGSHGVTQRDLMDGCKNIHVGAMLVASHRDHYDGDLWKAVGAY